MDINRSLKNVRLTLDITDSSYDELIMLILSKCETWLKFICGIEDKLPPELVSAAEDLAVIKYNMLGSEALSSESIGPINMTYDSLPQHIKQTIMLYKKVRF